MEGTSMGVDAWGYFLFFLLKINVTSKIDLNREISSVTVSFNKLWSKLNNLDQ